jgi:hypothetical protein
MRPTSISLGTPVNGVSRYMVCYVRDTSVNLNNMRFAVRYTSTQLNSLRSQGWRIEDVLVERFSSPPLYTALLRRDVNNWNKYWYFTNYSASQVMSFATAGNRLIDLDANPTTGYFSGVFVANTGAHYRGWAWLNNHTLSQINSTATQNNMRIIDVGQVSSNRFCAVMVARNPGERSEYFVVGGSSISDILSARAMRLQTLNLRAGSNWYCGVMVNNGTPQQIRIADLLSSSTSAPQGAYVKVVGGSELVNIRGDRVFYPASAIKVLIHAYGIRSVPVSQLTTYKIGNRFLSDIASKMMKESNNPDTYTLNSHWGTSNINAYGRNHLGTTSATYIKSHYGNPPPDGNFNAYAKLKDMCSIYEKAPTALGSQKMAYFKSWMLNETNTGLFDSQVTTARNSMSITTTKFNDWRSRFKFMWKGGNIGHSTGKELHFVIVGRATLPFKNGNVTVLRDYVFGYWVNEATSGLSSTLAWRNAQTVLYEQIRESMLTFR